ncbi:MAG: sulfotransferase family 2 domain-containing protein [Phormidesmis sp.]
MQKIHSNEFIIFLHIQKTGGITLQRMLRRKLGKSLKTRAISLLAKNNQFETVEQELRQKKREDRYVVGHFCYGIHQWLPQPYTYMSFVREPVARICSLYYYSRANPTAYYHQQAQSQSLEQFALQTQLMELDNGQVRFLAGDTKDFFINRTPIGKCDRKLLETAKQNIANHFSFIGITEQFDQSVLLLQQIMGWDSCLYLRRNSTNTSQKSKAALPDDLRQKIAERNWLDVQLYQHIQSLLAQRLALYKLEDPSTALKTFRQKNTQFNQRFGSVYTAYGQAKSLLRGQSGRPL